MPESRKKSNAKSHREVTDSLCLLGGNFEHKIDLNFEYILHTYAETQKRDGKQK